MSIEENQKNQLDLIIDAHGLDPVGHFFISESLRHIGEEAPLPDVEFVVHYGELGLRVTSICGTQYLCNKKSVFYRFSEALMIGGNLEIITTSFGCWVPQIEILMERLPNLKAVLIRQIMDLTISGSNKMSFNTSILGTAIAISLPAPIKFLDFMMKFGLLVKPTLNASK